MKETKGKPKKAQPAKSNASQPSLKDTGAAAQSLSKTPASPKTQAPSKK
jgi:hypothetical protein